MQHSDCGSQHRVARLELERVLEQSLNPGRHYLKYELFPLHCGHPWEQGEDICTAVGVSAAPAQTDLDIVNHFPATSLASRVSLPVDLEVILPPRQGPGGGKKACAERCSASTSRHPQASAEAGPGEDRVPSLIS